MKDKKSFYITTTLPYVNAEPHIGFAMELIHADVIARAKRLQGFDVFFNTGTDEHGQKVYKSALAENKDPKEYCDELAQKFKELATLLNLSEDLHFIRTTDKKHIKAAQKMWELCQKYIYFRNYEIKYCTGCELEKTDSELVDGKCPIHPDKEIEIREETNYFFRFSEFGQKLLDLYENKLKVTPDYRLNELRALIDRGLEDFSISRLKKKMPWGVSIPEKDPNGEEHVMYVWFDALVSYISTLGWPDDLENFGKFWDGENNIQVAGKDQVRQQAAMWQAMLLAADLPPTKNIVIHGFLNFGGQKMSKSLGNVISPKDMVDTYGLDATRVMLAGVNQFEDTDVDISVKDEGFDLAYKNNLANGLGNLVSRIMTLAETHLDNPVEIADFEDMSEFFSILNKFEVKNAIDFIWKKMWNLDKEIQDAKPWESKDQDVISSIVVKLYTIARMLNVFMPETSTKIKALIKANKKPGAPLFLRKDA